MAQDSKKIFLYLLFLTVYLNLFIGFLIEPFWTDYVSSLLLLGSPILGIWTFIAMQQVPEDGWMAQSKITAFIGFLIMLLWGQILFGLIPYLPPFWN